MDNTLEANVESHDRFMIFQLGNESYAISLSNVKEVIGVGAFTPVPNSPPYFKGVLNLRETVISIFDLGRKMKATEVKANERAIIILDIATPNVGVLVDGVESVIEVDPKTIQPAPNSSEQNSKSVKGVIREKDRLVLLLDINETLGFSKPILTEKTAA